MFGKLLDEFGPILIGMVLIGIVAGGIVLVTNVVGNKQAAIEQTLNEADYRDYTDLDGRDDIAGSTVQSFLTTHKNDNACIEVKTKSKTTQYNFTDKNVTTAVTDNNALIKTATTKKTDGAYINPSGKFKATVTRNDNGVITMITFEQQ